LGGVGRPDASDAPFFVGGVVEVNRGKIVYQPPEKAYTNVNIEETTHGYRLYRPGESRPFTVIPHSAVKVIEFKE
jgi:hypothetical protein